MTSWITLKFGGTSVATRDRWDTIAEVVRGHRDHGHRVLMVCSALAGVSDKLEALLEASLTGAHGPLLAEIRRQHRELADALGVDGDQLLADHFALLERLAHGASLIHETSPRLKARVMATGELMSTALGAAFLQQEGLSTTWEDARTLLQAQPSDQDAPARHYLNAHCSTAADPDLQAHLEAQGTAVVMTQGFIARDAAGDTVLLGRGGSDTSAAYLAARLQADRLEIWTDVPGLFTANPHQIPSARLLRSLGYDEAQELATMGAKVLHPRSVDPVRRHQIPLHIRSTEAPTVQGTVIAPDVPDVGAQVKALSVKAGVTLIAMDTLGMWQQVGFLADAFAVFKEHGLSVDLVATSETNVTVSLDPSANALDPGTIQALLDDLNAFCTAREIGPCAVLSLVGRNIRSLLNELAPVFEAFDEQQVYLVSQAASDLNLTFTVNEDQAPRLLRKLHAQLFDTRGPDDLLGPSWRELFGDLPDAATGPTRWWRERREALLTLAANESPCYVYDTDTLHAAVDTLEDLTLIDRRFYAIKANAHPDVLRLFEQRGLGFECVSPGEVDHIFNLFPDLDPGRVLFTPNFAARKEYAAAFARGIHVTLDNVHALESWGAVFEGQDIFIRVDPGRGHGHHRHVRTAGAQSKFGVSPPDLDRMLARAEALDVRVVGLHAHLGSGIRTPEAWSDTALFLASIAEQIPSAQILNLGGGLSVPERPGALPLDLDAFSAQLDSFCRAYPDYALWIEPGRFLVSEAGVLLTRVTQTKRKGDVRYVGVDTGMNSLIRPALYGAYHQILNLTKLDEAPTLTAEVVGPICETGDVLGHGRRLPPTGEGDVLLVATAGAYGRVMSSHYNLRPPATEHVLAEHNTPAPA